MLLASVLKNLRILYQLLEHGASVNVRAHVSEVVDTICMYVRMKCDLACMRCTYNMCVWLTFCRHTTQHRWPWHASLEKCLQFTFCWIKRPIPPASLRLRYLPIYTHVNTILLISRRGREQESRRLRGEGEGIEKCLYHWIDFHRVYFSLRCYVSLNLHLSSNCSVSCGLVLVDRSVPVGSSYHCL